MFATKHRHRLLQRQFNIRKMMKLREQLNPPNPLNGNFEKPWNMRLMRMTESLVI